MFITWLTTWFKNKLLRWQMWKQVGHFCLDNACWQTDLDNRGQIKNKKIQKSCGRKWQTAFLLQAIGWKTLGKKTSFPPSSSFKQRRCTAEKVLVGVDPQTPHMGWEIDIQGQISCKRWARLLEHTQHYQGKGESRKKQLYVAKCK